jgi:hypothetical protein
MRFYEALGLTVTLALAGCASKSADISPSYVSPVTYQNFTCEQLQAEAQGVSQRAAVAAGQQDKARKNDTIKTTVGVILFWQMTVMAQRQRNSPISKAR